MNGAYGQQGQGQQPQGGWSTPGPQFGGSPGPSYSGPQFGGPRPQQWGAPQSSFGGWGGAQTGPGFSGPAYGGPPPAPQWGPPPGMPQGGFPPPRQRRRSPAPLLIVIAVAALGLVGLLAFAAGGVGTDIVGPNYQNEDYQVPEATENQPPLPEPTTEEEMTQWLENNAWYAESLPEPVRCELPGSELPSGADNDTLQERMTELINCLTRTVGPSLEDAGLVAIQPRVTIYGPGAEITTQCGTASSHNAFYCPLDQALYLSPDIPQLLPSSEASAPYLFDFIMAHEYAHAMQGRSGILVASLIAQYLAETDAEAAELGRRIELQADCIATTMLTSVRNDMEISPEDFTTLSQVAMEIGDDSLADRFNIEYVADESSHGTGENRQMWSLRGADQHAVGACNTFTASSDEVR